MTRKLCAAAVASLVVLAGLAAAARNAGAEDPKTPTTKVVMQKLHKGAKSPQAKLKKELEGTKPDWKEVKANTKEFLTLSAHLVKNEPKKGEADSWKKFAEEFSADSKDMDTSAKEEDLKGTKDAFKKINASCKTCHTAHK